MTATSIGIGTTNPTVSLWVGGSGYFIGSVSSANGFYVNGSLIGSGSISGADIVGTALSISGISTLGTVQISSGIVTARSGVVTYYGDGRYLQNVVGFAVSLQSPVSNPVYPMFANNTGVTTAGISTTQFVFIPTSGNLGLGSTNPGSKLAVIGDAYVSGVVTATTFYGTFSGNASSATYATNAGTSTSVIGGIASVTQLNVSGITTLGVTSTTNLTSQQLNVSGLSTFAGITTVTGQTLFAKQLNVSGVVTATTFYGSASGLTDIPTTRGIVDLNNTTTGTLYYPTFVSDAAANSVSPGTGTTTGFNVTSTKLVFNASTGSLGIGTTNPTQPLHVLGNARVTGAIYDSTNSSGSASQVLVSTITGTQWAAAPAPSAVFGAPFDTGITTTTFVSVDSGIGTAITGISTVQANNDIFLGPGIALSFPNTAGNRYLVQSIHVANTFDNELYLTARHDFNNGTLRIPVANRVVVPYNGALELLEQPTVANPGDILRLQAFTGIGTTAGGVDGGLDAWITYTTKTDTNFVGVGTTVTTAGTNVGGVSTYQTVYTSTTYPSVIQSIRIANYNLFIDVDASIAIFSSLGIRKGHLAYNLTVPKNSIVELCQQPKRLQASETIGVSVGSTTSGGANALSVFVSSKYIT